MAQLNESETRVESGEQQLKRRSVWHFFLIAYWSTPLIILCLATFIVGSSAIVFTNWYLALEFILLLFVFSLFTLLVYGLWKRHRVSIVIAIVLDSTSFLLSLGSLIYFSVLYGPVISERLKDPIDESMYIDTRYVSLAMLCISFFNCMQILAIISAFKVYPTSSSSNKIHFKYNKICTEQQP